MYISVNKVYQAFSRGCKGQLTVACKFHGYQHISVSKTFYNPTQKDLLNLIFRDKCSPIHLLCTELVTSPKRQSPNDTLEYSYFCVMAHLLWIWAISM